MSFEKIFKKLLLESISTSGVGFGSSDNINSGDSYATNDNRIPKILNISKRHREGGLLGRCKKRKKNKNNKFINKKKK